MRQGRWGGLGILVLALAGCPLPAQNFFYGGQITASVPGSALGGRDWLHHRVGGGAGIHMLVDLGNGNAVVPRFDYTGYEKKPVKVQIFQLAFDFDRFISERLNDGPYLGGGLQLGSARFELAGIQVAGRGLAKTPLLAQGFTKFQVREDGPRLRGHGVLPQRQRILPHRHEVRSGP